MADDSQKIVRYGVVGVAVRSDGRTLVIRRSEFVPAPLKWCFPGGGIEPGEDEITALKREMREELGIHTIPVKRLTESETPWNVHLAWWQISFPENILILPNSREVDSYAWMTFQELRLHPDALESNHFFLEAVIKGGILLSPSNYSEI